MLEKIYIEDECMLRSIYLKMIDVFKNTNNSEEMLRVYIKLLSISYGSDNIDEYKTFLADAAGYVTKS
jgi:hypothetical protein